MPVKIRIAILFSLLVLGVLSLVCGSVYYFSYTNRIKDIHTRLENRAITTGKLLNQGGLFDEKLIKKIDASTTIAMKNKVIEAYDGQNRKIYWYSDDPFDSVAVDNTIIEAARKEGRFYFTVGDKDAIAYFYDGRSESFVIVTAAYDEEGKDKLRHLRLVLSLSFAGGILITIVGGYLFSIRLLHPIRRIADEVNEISARNLARRIHTAGHHPRDEWYYLSDTLNQLLNRLQESFEIQARFISNASHELSTPLTSISSQLEVSLQRQRSIEDYRQVILSVYQDVQQLNKLTQTLLEFARASGTAGGLEIDLVRIDEVLLRMPGEMTKMNAAWSVTLDFNRLPENEEELMVFGNDDLLFTATRNIVLNACKYSDDHHATISLEIFGQQINIRIADKGRGIDPKDLEKIFQPFYRSDEGHGIPGFGLGLSLANRIVKLHKGQIAVESVPGEGTCVQIILPTTGALRGSTLTPGLY
ncbi:MAG: HAMP domain-containing sensor histidine kinase [Puia sp.]|nr:HAMP domain-containing sensor histidine kinase [Puia sp.]